MSHDLFSLLVVLGLLALATIIALLKGPLPDEDRREGDPEVDAFDETPFGLTQEELAALGGQCAQLLCNGAAWIHRRKEALTLIDDRTLQRRLSLDFNVAEIEPVGQTGAGEPLRLVPGILLDKAPARFTSFDFEDQDTDSLPLPTRRENGAVSAATLHAAAERALQQEPGQLRALSPDLWEDLLAIAVLDRRPANKRLRDTGLLGDRELAGEYETLRQQPDFRWLVRTLAGFSIVVIPVLTEAGPRRIAKLSYQQRVKTLIYGRRRGLLRSGWVGYTLVVALPFVGARSCHLEAHLPTGLEIIEASAWASSRDGIASNAVALKNRRVHLYLPDADSYRSGLAIVRFRVQRQGFVTGAALAAGLVAATLGLFCVFAGDISANATAAPTILLLLPSAIAAYVSRPSDPLVDRLLTWARGFLVVAGLMAFAAATRLVLDPSTKQDPLTASHLREIWIPLAAGAGIAFVLLVATLALPISPRTMQRLRRSRDGARRRIRRAFAALLGRG